MAEIISPKKAPFFREAREKCFINADKKIRKRIATDDGFDKVSGKGIKILQTTLRTR